MQVVKALGDCLAVLFLHIHSHEDREDCDEGEDDGWSIHWVLL
jgi:hypothetical protein